MFHAELELPVLVIFTDGEFNQMVSYGGSFDTAHKKVIKMWTDAGYTKVPLMCYWNLSPNRNGVQASQDQRVLFFFKAPVLQILSLFFVVKAPKKQKLLKL